MVNSVMTEKTDLDNERKIKNWARAQPKFRKYLGNISLLSRLYAKHHKPEKVSDCIPDQDAKLTLMVVKLLGKNNMKLCSECGRKPGEKETTECGVSDFVDKTGYAYQAGDETGDITISVPPWYDDDPELEEEETYVVEGSIRKWEETLQIQPSCKMVQVDAEEAELSTVVKELLEAHKFNVPEKVFDSAVDGYDSDEVGKVLEEMGIELEGGMYKVVS